MATPLGFSTGFYWKLDWPIEKRLAKFLEISNEAVELHLQDPVRDDVIDDSVVELVKQFKYRSIHLPADIRYPSPEAEALLPIISELADRVDAHALVMHPDIIDDPEWVARSFDGRLALENMDLDKTFGQIPDDLLELFEKIPQAKWVFDINHAYTIDQGQMLGGSLFHNLSYRITHYHFSGWGGGEERHIPMVNANQDEMFKMIADKNVPIIIESVAQSESETPEAEFTYIQEHLAS